MTEFLGGAAALERGMLLVVLDHGSESGNAAGGKGLDRAGADAVDPDPLRAEIVGQITGAGLKGGLGDSHHIVVRDHLGGAIVAHRDNAAANSHHGGGFAGKGDQRIGADVMGDTEGLAARGDEIPFEGILGGKGDRVEHEVELRGDLADLAEEGGDIAVIGDIAGLKEGVGTEFGDEFLHVLLEALSLIIEEEGGTRLLPGLGDCPCDAAFVGDAENDADFTCEGSVAHPTRKPLSTPSCHAKSSWERQWGNGVKIWKSGNQEVRQQRESLSEDLELRMNQLLFRFVFPH